MIQKKKAPSDIASALNFPKKGQIIGGKKVSDSGYNYTNSIFTYSISFPKSVRASDIPNILKPFYTSHMLNMPDNSYVVRHHEYSIREKNGKTEVHGGMHILPIAATNPNKKGLTALEDFNESYTKMTTETPEKFFRVFDKPLSGSALRSRLFSFVGYMGENYGWVNDKKLFHRRASLIMPQIKITKAPANAHTFYHTHPSKDEPSLSSPDDYLLYLDLSHDPQNIRDFYTVMKDRIDHFKITPKKGTKKDFVKIDEEKFISELDAQLDIFQEKRSESMPDKNYQDDLQFCEQVTKDAVAWLNKKYGKYFTIKYRCYYRVRKNPDTDEGVDLHLGNAFVMKALKDVKAGSITWPNFDIEEMPHERYAFWHNQYYYMLDDQVKLAVFGFNPGSYRRITAYLNKRADSEYTYYDIMSMLCLIQDVNALDHEVRDGIEDISRVDDVVRYLELPEKIGEDLKMLDAMLQGEIFTEEAMTVAGDYYPALVLTHFSKKATEIMKEVTEGKKNIEEVKHTIYAREKDKVISAVSDSLLRIFNKWEAGMTKNRTNPPPMLTRGEFRSRLPSRVFEDAELVEEIFSVFDPAKFDLRDRKGFPKKMITGKGAISLHIPLKDSAVSMLIQPTTGTMQIGVPAAKFPPFDDTIEAATLAYLMVVEEANRYGFEIPTDDIELSAVEPMRNPAGFKQMILVSGPSGAGKSTIVDYLMANIPNSKRPPTYTTRKARKSDRNRGDRIHISHEQFNKMIAMGEFAEYRTMGDNLYGKTKKDLSGADTLIFDTGLSGVNDFREMFGDKVYAVYLEPAEDPKLIEKRLIARGDMSAKAAKSRAKAIPGHIETSKRMNFDFRTVTERGKFLEAAKRVLEAVPKHNPRKEECPKPSKKGITIYGAKWCKWCQEAKKYLDKQNREYTYIDIDEVSNCNKVLSQLTKDYQYIPMIFIDGAFIGGYSELTAEKNPSHRHPLHEMFVKVNPGRNPSVKQLKKAIDKKNVLGKGAFGTAFKIPGTKYVLKINRRVDEEYYDKLLKHLEGKGNKPDLSENISSLYKIDWGYKPKIGQPLYAFGENGPWYHMVSEYIPGYSVNETRPYQKDIGFGLDPRNGKKVKAVRQLRLVKYPLGNMKKMYAHQKALADMPQEEYDRFAEEIRFLTSKGLQHDVNDRNFKFDPKRQRLYLFDWFWEEKVFKAQGANSSPPFVRVFERATHLMSKAPMESYFRAMGQRGKFKRESQYFAKQELKAISYRSEILSKLTNAFNKMNLIPSKYSITGTTLDLNQLAMSGGDYIDLAVEGFLNPLLISQQELELLAAGEKIPEDPEPQFIDSEVADLPLVEVNPKERRSDPVTLEQFTRWVQLVNMKNKELEAFLASDLGKQAGLNKKRQEEFGGINRGRTSGFAILRMRKKLGLTGPKDYIKNGPMVIKRYYEMALEKWNPTDWYWCGRQYSFNSRSRGQAGPYTDKKGRPTRKLLALWVWGHDPWRYARKIEGKERMPPCPKVPWVGMTEKRKYGTTEYTYTNPRIPKKYEGQDPSEHSDLYTDEEPTNTIQGLGFKDEATAKKSIRLIKASGKTHAHKIQAAMAMEQRARFHPHQTPGIKAGQKVYAKFIEEMKKKTKDMRKNPPQVYYHGSPADNIKVLRKGSYVSPDYQTAYDMGRYHLDTKKSWTDEDLATSMDWGTRPTFKKGREPKGIPTVYTVELYDDDLVELGVDEDGVNWEYQTSIEAPVVRLGRFAGDKPRKNPSDFDEVIDYIFGVSEETQHTLFNRLVKLMEESGEIAEEVLIKEGYKPYKEAGKDGVEGEIADAIVVLIMAFERNGGTPEELSDLLAKSIGKGGLGQKSNPARTPEGRKIPKKYLKGLTKTEMAIAAKEIDKGYKYDVNDPKAYEDWKSDIKAKARGYKTVPSKYKKKFVKMYGPLPEKGDFLTKMSKATGVKKKILKKVRDKGLAAWATGHRVGVTPHQWAAGRVYSFVTLGNTVMKGKKKMGDYSLAVEAGLIKDNPSEADFFPGPTRVAPYYMRAQTIPITALQNSTRHDFVDEEEDPFSDQF